MKYIHATSLNKFDLIVKKNMKMYQWTYRTCSYQSWLIRDDFNFCIVNFPYICSYIVYPSLQLMVFTTRVCSLYGDFIDRGRLLTKSLLLNVLRLGIKIYFRKFYGRIQYSITTLQYSPFTVFVWPSPLLM